MGLDQNGGFDDNQAAGNETTTLKNGFVFNDTTPFNGTEVVEEVAQLKIYKPLCDDQRMSSYFCINTNNTDRAGQNINSQL